MELTAIARRCLTALGYRFVYDDIACRIVAYAPEGCTLGNRVFRLV